MGKIDNLFNFITEKNIISNIYDGTIFCDEPQFPFYISVLNLYSEFKDTKKNIVAAGMDLDREVALTKCLVETLERYYLYDSSDSLWCSLPQVKSETLNLENLEIHFNGKEPLLSWVWGYELMDKKRKKVLIPTQLVYFHYKNKEKEALIQQPRISTGSAGGFSEEFTMVKGMYEVIERDAYITLFLNNMLGAEIDLEDIDSSKIQNMNKELEEYKIVLHVYDVSNDLEVPVFLSIALDYSGLGPAVTSGLKASFNQEEAIIGSIFESLLSRPTYRSMYMVGQENVPIGALDIESLDDRYSFWADMKNIRSLTKMMDESKTKKAFHLRKQKLTLDEEYEKLISLLLKKGHSVYFAQVPSPELAKIQLNLGKIIIPSLQPLYISDNHKMIREKRLKDVASYFGKKNIRHNTLPLLIS